jgi:predicted nucleic acid-binding protein
MNTIILLDSTPVGLITNPRKNEQAQQCQLWFDRHIYEDDTFILPEIVDYEIRRELLRANKLAGLEKLDRLKSLIFYLPITTEVMLKAAELWAETRKKGKPTADSGSLDGDVILAAQALSLQKTLLLNNHENEVIIATSNKKHLSLFIKAENWQEI